MGKLYSKEKSSDELGVQRRDPHFLFKVRERLKVLESRTNMSDEENTTRIFQMLVLGTFVLTFVPPRLYAARAGLQSFSWCLFLSAADTSQTAQLFFPLLTPVVGVYSPPAVFSVRSMAAVAYFHFL